MNNKIYYADNYLLSSVLLLFFVARTVFNYDFPFYNYTFLLYTWNRCVFDMYIEHSGIIRKSPFNHLVENTIKTKYFNK